MKLRWLVVMIAGLSVVAAGPALAGAQKKAKRQHIVSRCAPQPAEWSWRDVWYNTEPRPNGCSPAVHQYGRFIGQDPDPNIRFQLMRDPETGYTQTK